MIYSLPGATAVGLLAIVGLVCFGTPAAAVDGDVRGYITQSTPGYKWCDAGSGICLDGYRNEYNDFILSYTHGIIDHFERRPQAVTEDAQAQRTTTVNVADFSGEVSAHGRP